MSELTRHDILNAFAKKHNLKVKYTYLKPINQKIMRSKSEDTIIINDEEYLLSRRIKNAYVVLQEIGSTFQYGSDKMQEIIDQANKTDVLNRQYIPKACGEMKEVYLKYVMDCLLFLSNNIPPKPAAMERYVESTEQRIKDTFALFDEISQHFINKATELDLKCIQLSQRLDELSNRKHISNSALMDEYKRNDQDTHKEKVKRSTLIREACVKAMEEDYKKVMDKYYNYILGSLNIPSLLCLESFKSYDLNWYPYNVDKWMKVLPTIPLSEWDKLKILFEYYEIDVEVKVALEKLIAKRLVEHYDKNRDYEMNAMLVLGYRILDEDVKKSFEKPEPEIFIFGDIDDSGDFDNDKYVDVLNRYTVRFAFADYFIRRKDSMMVKHGISDEEEYFAQYADFFDEVDYCPFLIEKDKQIIVDSLQIKYRKQKPREK